MSTPRSANVDNQSTPDGSGRTGRRQGVLQLVGSKSIFTRASDGKLAILVNGRRLARLGPPGRVRMRATDVASRR